MPSRLPLRIPKFVEVSRQLALRIRRVKEPRILLQERIDIRMRLLRILSHQLDLPNSMPEIRRIKHDREPIVRQKRNPRRHELSHRIQPEIILESQREIREMKPHELVYLAPVLGFGECGS